MPLTRSWMPLLAVVLSVCCSNFPAAAGGTTIACRMNDGPCAGTTGPMAVTLDISPRPLKVMSELVFSVALRERDAPFTGASVMVGLTMPGMVMGTNIVKLFPKGNGVYEGTGVIIRCPTGKKIWQATVMIERGGRKRTVDYIFEVTQ